MNKKDLLSKIKQTALDEMPDVRDRIDLSKAVIEPEYESIKQPITLRKVFSYTFASLFIVVSAIIGLNFVNLSTDSTPLENETEIVGFQTVSAAALLDSFQFVDLNVEESDESLTLLKQTTTTTLDSADVDDLLTQLRLINNYLNMAETVLVEDGQYLYQAVESDNTEYAYAFQYNGTDLNGNLITYTGYYNIVEIDGVQTEQGMLIHDGSQYEYTTVATGSGEELQYSYQIRIDAENYIEVSNNSTEDSQSFQYKVYENNELQNQSTVTLVKEKKNLQATVQIINIAGDEITLNIQRENGETSQFRVSYMLMKGTSNSSGEFTVSLEYDETTQTYQYRYVINNEVVTESRGNKGNRQATEDDFEKGNSSSQNPFVSTATTTSEEDNNGNQNTTADSRQGGRDSGSDASAGASQTVTTNANGL